MPVETRIHENRYLRGKACFPFFRVTVTGTRRELASVITVEEARWVSVRRLASNAGLEERVVRDALSLLARVEREAGRYLEDAGFDVSEVNPVMLLEGADRVYTGDWVGFVAINLPKVRAVSVKPKVGIFEAVLEDAFRGFTLLGLRGPLPRLLQSLRDAGALRTPGAVLAAWVIEEWLRLKPPMQKNLVTAAYMLVAALRQVVALSPPGPLRMIVAAPLVALSAHPLMTQALIRMGVEEPVIEAVEEASMLARLSGVYPGGYAALALLLPAPKLFEIAVLTRVVEALVMLGCRVVEVHGFRVLLGCGPRRAKIYYNEAPRSTIVEALAGRRLRPDVAIETSDAIILLEAKYRRCTRRMLNVEDALRIAAYIGDVKPDKLLVVHPCNKPHHRINDTVELVSYMELDKVLVTILEEIAC